MTYTFKISRRLAGNHTWIAAIVAAGTLLVGCVVGASDPVLTKPVGSLTVTVQGLSDNAGVQAVLTGSDGVERIVTSGSLVAELPLGSYRLRFLPAIVDGDRWVASPEVQNLLIQSTREVVQIAASYVLSSGELTIQSAGLPTGAAATFQVTGPGGYTRLVVGDTSLRGLEPGSYTLTAIQHNVGSAVYRPSQATTQVMVEGSRTPTKREIQFVRAFGILQIQAIGLPNGAVAHYAVSGPGGFSAERNGVGSLASLDPGTYVLTPTTIEWEGNRWAPTSPSLTVAVDTGTAVVEIPHAIATGTLEVELEGLPVGVTDPVVNISGPAGFVRELNASQHWVGVEPGTYTATAASVTHGSRRFVPTRTNQNIPVPPSTHPSRAKITYTESTGALTLTVNGLPAGAAGRVIVIGPGLVDTVLATTTLSGLPLGTYALAAANVTINGTVYEPTPVSQAASIVAGSTTTKSVTYAVASPTTGSLNVAVTGLSGGTSGAITVTGPGGFRETVTTSTTLNALVPGSYTLAASDVTVGGATFQPTPASQTATISAGTTTSKSVAYAVAAPTSGTLTVTVNGLPGGGVGAVAVTGPNDFSRTFGATTTLNDLAPGTYAIAAANVTAGGSTYQPTPASLTATITAGATTTKAFMYWIVAPSTGSLTVTVTGLPGGASGAVAVTGPNDYSRTLTATTTLTDLAPGSYAIAAANVTAGGSTYQPTPASQTAAITANNTTSKSIAYAVAAPTTGALTVTVTGLPGGVSGAVAVTGPNDFSRTLTATTTLNDLAAGSYAIAAANVSSSGSTYQPTPASQTATITAGTTTSKAIAYAVAAPTTGALTVTVTGLPGGAAGALAVSGPSGFTATVTSTTTLNGLAAGNYTIAASNISSGGTSYQPTPASQTATVTAGSTTGKSVAYAAVVAGPQVTLNSGIHYQTMDMWETSLRMWEQDKIADRFAGTIESYTTAVANYLVDSVGINGVRLQLMSGLENPQNYWAPFYAGSMSYSEWSPSRYEKINDNNDPNVANLAGFQFEAFDYQVEKMVLPIKARLDARGEQLHININYLDFKWNAARQGSLNHATNPAEFAEFILVFFQHLQSKYGLSADAFEMILEPENTVSWSGDNIGRGLVAVAARLAANGFHPQFIAPSTTAMNNALPYFNALLTVPGAGNLVSTLAYHRYGGESEANAIAIRNAAAARGIKTAMLEKVGAGIDELMEDLTVANASGWQQWGMADESGHADAGAYYLRVNLAQSGSSAISFASRTRQLAQVFRSVRRGAVRIGSTSSASNHVTAAFINPDGRWAAIVRSRNSGGPVTINGLPAGRYEIRFASEAGTEAPSQTVTIAGPLTTTLPSAGTLSVRGVP